MPEVSSAAVLRQVLRDISGVRELLDGCSALTKALKKDGLQKEEFGEITEKTRCLIEKLKSEVERISTYFSVARHNGDVEEEGEVVGSGPQTDGAGVNINGGDDVGGSDHANELSCLNGNANDATSENLTVQDESPDGDNDGSKDKAGDATASMSTGEVVTSKTAKSNLDSTNSSDLEEDVSHKLGNNLAEPADDKPEGEKEDESVGNLEEEASIESAEETRANAERKTPMPVALLESTDKLEEGDGDSNDDDEDDDAKQEQIAWKIKCVDINKLINPDLLSSKDAAAAADEGNESVVVLSDSEPDGNFNNKKPSDQLKSLLSTNEFVVKRIQKGLRVTMVKQSKGVIVLDDTDSDSSDDVALSKMRGKDEPPRSENGKPNHDSGKAQDKKRKSVRFNVSDGSDKDDNSRRKVVRFQARSKQAKKKCAYTSSEDSEGSANAKVKKKQRKKQLRDQAGVSSFSDTCSDSDGDEDGHKKSRRKTSARSEEDPAALERRLIASQTDDKFSWRVYVSLTKVTADKLKENYKNRLLKNEINSLTNLDSLKRSRRTAKGSQSSDSADSMSVKKQRVYRSKDIGKEDANSSSSDKSDCEVEQPTVDPLALPEEVEQVDISADKEDNVIATVLVMTSGSLSSAEISKLNLQKGIRSGSESPARDDDSGGESKESDTEHPKSSEKDGDGESKEKGEPEQEEQDPKVPEKEKGGSWRKDKLLTEKLSESDSDEHFSKFMEKKKKKLAESQRMGKRKVRIVNSDSDSSCKPVSSNENSDKESHSSDSSVHTEKTKNTKRRRIRTIQDSSDEADDKDTSTRKNIRKVWANDSLAETTKQAEKEEQERKTRIAERQKKYNQLYNVDELQKAKVDKVVLDFNEETKEELLQVDRRIVKHMKPHQAKGVQFMWTACFESLERAKNTKGSGCILAHCMGLGKTLQVIALTHALLSKSEEAGVSKVLVVTPLNTVLNWVAEFKKWLPDEDDVEVYELVSHKQNYERQYEVQHWAKNGGVLILGYDMFRNLTNPTNKRLNKKMRNVFQSALVDPGPDLVVCDEGHLLKNEKTSLSVAMNRLRTLRRIVLTGTPLQNNLKEYFCMVQFVKPNLLGTYKEYLNRFVNPITNGQYTNSTQHDTQVMRKRSHVLHKLLDGTVQRRDYAVLAPFLPPKYEYILFINLSEVQIKLYEHYLREKAQIRTSNKGKSYLFIDFQEFLRICTHPRVLTARGKKEFVDDDDEDSEGSLKEFIDDREESTTCASSDSESNSGSATGNEARAKPRKPTRVTRSTADQIVLSDNESAPPDPSEWWRQYCQNGELECLNHSGKLFLLFEILHECEQIGDKILVFSQSLYSLDVIEYFLSKVDEASQNEENDTAAVGGHPASWALGLDYFRLDGSSSCDNRASWCKTFNDPENTRARLFLISTRAGGLGINLVAANRVIIFDVSWNPSHDVQSIYRVYRFGQLKPCYVYRFVTLGTMEMKIYERQVIKQSISKRVIDEQQIDRHYNQNDLAELYKFEPKPDDEDRPTPLVPKDVLLGELLQKFDDRIYKYHEHQSLLENKEEECLNEDERKAAWEEFEYEKKARQFPNVLNNIPIQTVVLALTSIIQKDNPTWDNSAVQSIVPQLVKELEQQLQFGNMSMYNRILNEVRLMQNAKQQQRLQEYYYRQQQQALMMRQFQMMKQNASQYPMGALPFSNQIPFNPGPSAATPVTTSEVIELND